MARDQDRIGGELPTSVAGLQKPLTGRELACLQMLADGSRSMRIAAELNVATVTVEMHLRNARRKLGALTMAHAVAIALRDDIIT